MNFRIPLSKLHEAARLAGLLLALPPLVPAVLAQPNPAPDAQHPAIAPGRIDVEGGLVKLGAARDGTVVSVHAIEGADVKRGALLAQLDDRQARLLLEAANNDANELTARAATLQIKLAAAERELARVEPLVASLAVARAERDEKRDQVALLRAESDTLRAQAASTQTRIKLAALEVELRALRAPADGRLIKRFARAGDSVQAASGAPLFLFAPSLPRVARISKGTRPAGK